MDTHASSTDLGEESAPAFDPQSGVMILTNHYAALMAMAHVVRELLASANAGEGIDPVEKAILHGVILFDKDAPEDKRFVLTNETAAIFAYIDSMEAEIAAETEVEVKEAVS